ncbi:MAG: primosomal protein N' [Breznakia sp.]
MMKVAEVYIEYSSLAVDRSFTYTYKNENLRAGMRVFVRFANREIMGFVVKTYEMSETQKANLTYKIQPILSCVDDEPLLNDESFALAHYMAKACVAPLICCFQVMLPSKLKPKRSNLKIKKDIYVIYVKSVPMKGKKQQEALTYMMKVKEVKRSDFNKRFSCLQRLLDEGATILVAREASANLFTSKVKDKVVSLNEEQMKAIQMIQNKRAYHVHLLHGVTGSGKTEVFLRLASQVLKEGKQVLILVPEISLTPQMLDRVKARFGEDVAIYHSELNNQEKYEQFQLVKKQQVSIVVGTRSAVFMPFDRLGLIIMDEEHDQSYKQSNSPRYHCRDIANARAQYHQCPLVLASATPSLESYARAYKGIYQLIELKKRIFDNPPRIHIVDMKKEMKNGGDYVLSEVLKCALYECLHRHEQSIILLNRRGYAPMLRCVDCGHVQKCAHCDLTLNYHKTNNRLLCHTCGYQETVKLHCPQCHGHNIRQTGLGTQRLQEHIQSLFPTAKILRMDADTTKKKGAHKKMLSAFGKGDYDILLGTQMISKGLDFERVSLVGIVNGDALLARNNYQSVEMNFDLLTQASGRSGRGLIDGEVYIQVYDPKHYAIRCVEKHSYFDFFKQEMQFRHVGKYPPYYYLASIIFKSKQESLTFKEASDMKEYIKDKDIRIVGPASLLKRKDSYQARLLLKSQNLENLQTQVSLLKDLHLQQKCKTILEIDINPLHIE